MILLKKRGFNMTPEVIVIIMLAVVLAALFFLIIGRASNVLP